MSDGPRLPRLRESGPGRTRVRRDPEGKRALFSSPPPGAPVLPSPEGAATGEVAPPAEGSRRPGTVVVECSACGARTRVGYLDFALLNLPFGVWLPVPGLRHNRRMTCPACKHWAWMRADWTS